MIITIIVVLLSILLDGIMSCLFKDFISFFLLASILILLIINEGNKNYYIIVFIFGIMYDLFYTNMMILTGFIFIFIIYIISFFIRGKFNFIKMFLLYNFSIILYIFLMFIFTFFINYNIKYIIFVILKSLLVNYMYFTFIYIIVYIIYYFKRNRIKKYT